MNKQENDILRTLFDEPFINQRILAETSGHSLGVVNRSIKSLINDGYLTEDIRPTQKAISEYNAKAPKNAIILAAGFGMRMVPINLTVPKALLVVNNEPLIERLIKQLHDVGITDITVIVGFMKERFDYLIDEYGVKLIVNNDYSNKNNLFSLSLAVDEISNTYIVPSDIWCDKNPFNEHEMYSWYMVSDLIDNDSSVRINRKMELVSVKENVGGNTMIGITYLIEEEAGIIRKRLKEFSSDSKHNEDFWEVTLYDKDKMIVSSRVVHSSDVVEINTYEQLRELDGDSNHLKSDALDVIAGIFNTKLENIVDIQVLKKGMTNRSFYFSVDGAKYIMRIPGEGTDKFINRANEDQVYKTISGLGLCDDPIYINRDNGYKITKFLDGIRIADAYNIEDIKVCMKKLRSFHNLKLKVDHVFDLFGQIDFYEKLWNGRESIYKDYKKTKEQVLSLKYFIDSQQKDWCLTHIDAVPDNFLFYTEYGEHKLQLTDWEYSGMQDPHLDIAMWSIYSFYNKSQIDRIIDIYFEGVCDKATVAKIYCYVSAAGLLWSNWCEYKSSLGVEFGEYAMKQYRYAKDFYQFAIKEIDELESNKFMENKVQEK